jgi:hypothetical protein
MSMWDSAHWTCGSWTIVRFGRPKKPLHKGSKKSQKKAIGKLLCSFQSRKHNPWSWVHKKGDEINCATLQKFVAQSLLLYLVKVSKMSALLKSPMCDKKNGAMKHEAEELRRGRGDSVPVSKPQCWTSIPWTRKGMESYSGTQPILIVLLVLATTIIIIMVWNLSCQIHKNASMVPSLTNGSYNPLPFSIMLTCQRMKPLRQ